MDEGTGDIKYEAMSRYFSDDVYDKLKDTFHTCSDRTGKFTVKVHQTLF